MPQLPTPDISPMIPPPTDTTTVQVGSINLPMSLEEIQNLRLQTLGEPQTISIVPKAGKMSFNTVGNYGWQIVSTMSKIDPLGQYNRTIFNVVVDMMYGGEGVDVVCMDGGDSLAISDHPEWMSTKYPDVNRFVKYDWTSTSPYSAVTGTVVSATNVGTEYAVINLPKTIDSQLTYGIYELSARKIVITSGPGAGQVRQLEYVVDDGDKYRGYVLSIWDTVPTSSSIFRIDPHQQPTDYYDTYVTSTHGTGSMGLAAGKSYGYAKESMLYTIGSHGPTELVRGKVGTFAFSGSTITSSDPTIVERLSMLSQYDTIVISGATTASNNRHCTVTSNVLSGSTRIITVSNAVFVAEAAKDDTIIQIDRHLWGMSQGIDLVTAFHKAKTNGRPTVFVCNLALPIAVTKVSTIQNVISGGQYETLDLTTPEGIASAMDQYYLPFNTTNDKKINREDPDVTAAANRATQAGVILVLPGGNYNTRIVDNNHPDYNDYATQPGSLKSTGTVTAATAITVQLSGALSSSNVGDTISIVSGVGSNQNRVILSVSGNTATISSNWTTIPGSGSAYSISSTNKLYYNRGHSSSIPHATVAGAISSQYASLDGSNKEYRADYSCTGPRIDVFAPADNTVTASFDVTSVPFWNGVTQNGYNVTSLPYTADSKFKVDFFSGTSAAVPCLGGLAACIAQARPWIDSGSMRASIQDISIKDRLYDNPLFSDDKSLGGAPNNYMWYPFQHIAAHQ